MKPLCMTILTIAIIVAVILRPDFWFPTMLVGFCGAIAIDEVD